MKNFANSCWSTACQSVSRWHTFLSSTAPSCNVGGAGRWQAEDGGDQCNALHVLSKALFLLVTRELESIPVLQERF